MTKKLKITFAIIITIICLLILNKQIGYINAPFFSVPNDCVRVKFKNESTKTIKTLQIFNGPTIKNLKNGESYLYTYKHSGEGTYQFVVEFLNGDKLIEDERYVEAGYYNTEIIKRNSVETQY